MFLLVMIPSATAGPFFVSWIVYNEDQCYHPSEVCLEGISAISHISTVLLLLPALLQASAFAQSLQAVIIDRGAETNSKIRNEGK
jgi:hypothetical protein